MSSDRDTVRQLTPKSRIDIPDLESLVGRMRALGIRVLISGTFELHLTDEAPRALEPARVLTADERERVRIEAEKMRKAAEEQAEAEYERVLFGANGG